jgi:isocitrate dehydrogenase
MLRIVNTAVEKAYGGQKSITWMEIYAGERADSVNGSDEWLPAATLIAIEEYVVGIKGASLNL